MEVKVTNQESNQIKKHTEMAGTESLVSEKIASLKGIPTKEDLGHLLKQNVLVVDFTKLDGAKRVMTCTLREDMKPLPEKKEPLSQEKVRKVSDAVVSVWDVNAKGWRSFRYDRINAVDIVDEYENEWYRNDDGK